MLLLLSLLLRLLLQVAGVLLQAGALEALGALPQMWGLHHICSITQSAICAKPTQRGQPGPRVATSSMHIANYAMYSKILATYSQSLGEHVPGAT